MMMMMMMMQQNKLRAPLLQLRAPLLPLLSLILLVHLSVVSVDASISIAETGQTFDSKPERYIGQRLWKGYEYMGRLQYLTENPTLCPPPSSSGTSTTKFRINQPSDGLPVALLARRGGCSVAEKAIFAATMIEPANTVQYLIVEDYGRKPRRPRLGTFSEIEAVVMDDVEKIEERGLTELDVEEDELEHYNDESFFDGIRLLDLEGTWAGTSKTIDIDNIADPNDGALQFSVDSSFVGNGHENESDHISDINAEESRDVRIDNDTINLAVLHVSYIVGNNLLQLINNEPRKTRYAGGIKIFLNGKEPSLHARTIIVWMLLTLITCACCCCCMLMFVQTSIEPEQPQAPQRPRRRRLTLEQVRSNFPAFHFDPAIHHQQTKPPESSQSDDGTDSETASQKMYCELLDECTICLDEFSEGDRCRQLPCGHIFHSTCIARWLIERSAVCPLCKLDLYEEEEEEENSTDEEEEATTPSSAVLSWWGEFFTIHPNSNVETTALVQSDGDNDRSNQQRAEIPAGSSDTNNTTDEADQAQTSNESRSWWPFSLEIGDGSTDEAVEFSNSTDENPSGRSTGRARRGLGWSLNWFGQRRLWSQQHQQQGAVEAADGSMVTELTEPLISDGDESPSLEENAVAAAPPASELQSSPPATSAEI
mmetsp:Transcript_58094/g.142001  ORF Transcript_58094/g.142001 Transcript_58094/m.142001 type:complete len:653 (-) Transcript_58094:84-2042(-)